MRKLAIVLSILLAFGMGGGVGMWFSRGRLHQRFTRELKEVEYLGGALTCYAERNAGLLPNSWDDLVAAGIGANQGR